MHTSFLTTTRGLKRNLPPMGLYEKARGALLDEINRELKDTEDAHL